MLFLVVVLLSMIVGYRCLNVVMAMRRGPCSLLNIDVRTVLAIVPVSYEGPFGCYKTMGGLEPRHENFITFWLFLNFQSFPRSCGTRYELKSNIAMSILRGLLLSTLRRC